jgi:hypothetical protein
MNYCSYKDNLQKDVTKSVDRHNQKADNIATAVEWHYINFKQSLRNIYFQKYLSSLLSSISACYAA